MQEQLALLLISRSSFADSDGLRLEELVKVSQSW
jgi:hypothetical protein